MVYDYIVVRDSSFNLNPGIPPNSLEGHTPENSVIPFPGSGDDVVKIGPTFLTYKVNKRFSYQQ